MGDHRHKRETTALGSAFRGARRAPVSGLRPHVSSHRAERPSHSLPFAGAVSTAVAGSAFKRPRLNRPGVVIAAGSLSMLATVTVVGVGVASFENADGTEAAGSAAVESVGDPTADASDVAGRQPSLSRGSLDRQARQEAASDLEIVETPDPLSQVEKLMLPAAVDKAIKNADTEMWATTDLNLWTEPGKNAKQTGLLESGKKVTLTGRSLYGRDEIVQGEKTRWVTTGYFSEDEPVAAVAASGGLTMAPCPDGGVESGLTSGAVAVYRAVCNNFPQITSYGGYDAHGEHASGKAIDIMTSDVELGTAIAEFLKANASALGLYDVIWRQHIWTPVRASEGWRSMPSRGSATADHYDHVHVAVN